jgi:hypothetical protein
MIKSKNKIMATKLKALRVYVSDEESKRVDETAKLNGMTVSNLIRSRLELPQTLRGKYERGIKKTIAK